MSIQQAYNSWSAQYDTNVNKTRDLEAIALRTALDGKQFTHCLEIGCGTGKNTVWLMEHARQVTAVDLSEEMLNKVKEKINAAHVEFIHADITGEWNFAAAQYDLVTFSLVLEHIENLDAVFENVARVMRPGGMVYIGELHPFKQYTGSKARFETEQGVEVVTCYIHHISEFTTSAKRHGFSIAAIHEYFDEEDEKGIPRILSILLNKD